MTRWYPSLLNDSYNDISDWPSMQLCTVLPTFLCVLSFRKISVASRRCWFSKILGKVSVPNR